MICSTEQNKYRHHLYNAYPCEVNMSRRTVDIGDGTLEAVVEAIPDAWLGQEPGFARPQEQRAAYLAYLTSRLEASPVFVEEALHARAQFI